MSCNDFKLHCLIHAKESQEKGYTELAKAILSLIPRPTNDREILEALDARRTLKEL